MLWIIIPAVLIVAVMLFLRLNPQFGGRMTRDLALRYSQSPQWDGRQFVNATETVMDINLKSMPGLLKEQFSDTSKRRPQQPIPLSSEGVKQIGAQDSPAVVWLGHSAALLRLAGKNLLIDPMLGPDTVPFPLVSNKRFSEGVLDLIDAMPPIDAVLMTHDHYDHLDYASIQRLKGRVNHWLVSLGVGRHLVAWGVPAEQIQELDWWDETDFQGIRIACTPSRHFSGRGLNDRGKSLWGGWVFLTDEHRIYWSGDGGYGGHFSEVGEKYGPFDWGFMECGQYNQRWHAIHMYPEEAVQAVLDAGVKHAMPVHWGGFNLSLHSWKEPILRFTAEAQRVGLAFSSPQPGELVKLGKEENVVSDWWEGMA